MGSKTHRLIQQLKAAREASGLSQRALAEKLGVPQSHISKIESGKVNPTLSSLTEMARLLNRELMLVPQKYLSATEAMLRSGDANNSPRPAYQLDEDDNG